MRKRLDTDIVARPSTRGRASAVVALVVGLAMVAVGCGGSSSPAPQAAPEPTTSTSAAGPTTTTTTTSTIAASVSTTTRRYTDPSRTTPRADGTPIDGRVLLTQLWVPSTTGRRPLIVLAHGLAGEPDEFGELATAWARAGYVVAAPRFPVSSVTGGGRADDLLAQPGDVSYVLDQIVADADLRIDDQRIGVAGLSLGGSTIYALVTDTCCRDGRIKAAAIFDGVRPEAFPGGRLVPNDVPVLVMHCEADPVLPYQAHARLGFARLVAPAWLVTMPCQEHVGPYLDTRSAFHALVQRVTLDLWASAFSDRPSAAGDPITADVTADGRARVEHKA